jgi:hypothetical protein
VTCPTHKALVDAVRVRPNRHAITMLTSTLEMLDDIADSEDGRIEASALRDLIDMNARIGIALALGDANCVSAMRSE